VSIPNEPPQHPAEIERCQHRNAVDTTAEAG